ncbi:Taxane 13-alpha-hydroxylase [Acorus gramineus]|uniref:Taxane 13-alpha-hydroxylase n=1 Tax=Acorus gramineus TaxID=55184 RepID=A0AAV9AL41_ACOGR|nr:Taxane 13-alpha-hydroxylase [Acorus gramineus]
MDNKFWHFFQPSENASLFMFFTTTTLILILIKFILTHSASKNIPPGSLGFPVLGEAWSFQKALLEDRFDEWVSERVAKYGPVFKTSLMGHRSIVMTGQAGNRFIFTANDNALVGHQTAPVISIIGEHSLFVLNGARHRLVKSAVFSFLRSESLQRFVGVVDDIVKRHFIQALDGKDTMRVIQPLKETTFKVMCRVIFGFKGEEVESDDHASFFNDFLSLSMGLWSFPIYFPTTTYYRALGARRRVVERVRALVRRRKGEVEAGRAGAKSDIVSCLLCARDDERGGGGVREEEIVDNLITLMMGSNSTAVSLLASFIKTVARDDVVRKAVLEEQKKVMNEKQNKDGNLGWMDVQKMKYTWSVGQELMRTVSPAFGNQRRVVRDTTFNGFHIPKGWQVLWVTTTHKDKAIFRHPEKFDPSRFKGGSSAPPFSYVPFGGGLHICPGYDYVRILSLVVVHHLILNYQWSETVADEPITRNPFAYPAMGLPIKLYRRN